MEMSNVVGSHQNVSEPSGSPSEMPEYRLIVRMMELALQDATEKYDSEKRQDAQRWLTEQRTGPLSASWVADMMGLDIGVIRFQVKEHPARVHRTLTQAHKRTKRSWNTSDRTQETDPAMAQGD